MTGWLQEIHDHLGLQTEAIRAALEDVRELCGESAIGRVERPRVGQQGKVTVYVLADGVLHRVSGELDPTPDGHDPGAHAESTCEYSIEPLGELANYTVSVTARLGPPQIMGHGAQVLGTVRRWQFTGLGLLGSLTFESLRPDQWSSGPDPTPFAKALVAEILRIKKERRRSSARDENAGEGEAS